MKPDILRAALDRAPAERTVTLLGATGSVGASTIDLLKRERKRFRVEAVSANKNAAALAAAARELDARFAAIGDPAAFGDLKTALSGTGIKVAAGESGLMEAAERPAEWVIGAITGAAGLKPTLAAAGATVLPVDSEHNALFQAMSGSRREDVRRVILTASGGPFRTAPADAVRTATVEQALKHPNWSMGAKITIDSATLMNKGLELIEAHHLFALAPEQIDVLVHPQSIVHSLVEFCDGSLIAQLGSPDMRIPIAYCLAWPERIVGPAPRLDLARAATLTFEEPDLERFTALGLARSALEAGGAAPPVLNAANEVAVGEFLARRLNFAGISALVEATLEAALSRNWTAEPESVDEALSVDHNTRLLARTLLPEIAAKAP